jgi:hypothetical protein
LPERSARLDKVDEFMRDRSRKYDVNAVAVTGKWQPG